MKTHNASLQERITWHNILGVYENQLRKFSEKLKKELRQAHYSGREEICKKLQAPCELAADIIQEHRLSLGNIPKE